MDDGYEIQYLNCTVPRWHISKSEETINSQYVMRHEMGQSMCQAFRLQRLAAMHWYLPLKRWSHAQPMFDVTCYNQFYVWHTRGDILPAACVLQSCQDQSV